MMKNLLFLILCTAFSYLSISAKPVDESSAKLIGTNFLQLKTPFFKEKSNLELELVYIEKSKAGSITSNARSVVYFYVFNAGTFGFVMVSGDDIVIPILAYSDEANFNPNNIPSNSKKWFESYVDQIRFAVENKIEATSEIETEWQSLLENKNNVSGIKRSVTPLIQTKWDQSPYYNALCPYDNTYSERTVSGCVATAMAQVMKFWNYPTTGSGFHSYNHSTYGKLSANFGSTTYNWSSMPNKVTSANSSVATLMYHCGVSVDMNYGVGATGGSGAAGATKVAPSLISYFGYPASVKYKEKKNFSSAQWISLLKQELDAGRPMYYEGIGSGGGHAFVCDGYDNNDYFHFNWGWSGSADGYFVVSFLNPGSLGTGGGSGGFNSNQKVVIGIQPPSGVQTFNMALYNYVTPSSNTIYYGNAFTVASNIVNKGANTFNGDYCAAIFDEAYNFIDFVEVRTGFSLQGGYKYNNDLVFSSTGLFSMLPGKYYTSIFYKPTGGDWISLADNGSYSNSATITVVNPNDIEMNSNMTVTPSLTLTKGQAASVNLNLVNTGNTTYTGMYSVGLYNLDGSFVQTINTINETSGLSSNYTYSSPFLTFSTSNITANPGTYLLAVQHKPSNSSSWELVGSTDFSNPIKINVKLPGIQPDIYEPNNLLSNAYSLPLTFSGNLASKTTTGSNCHIGTDYDYYKVSLPAGYNYSIAARIHDSYNSGNGSVYSLDGVVSYSLDGSTWSDAFDDVVSNQIFANGGSTVYFMVSPYFTGETGTYLLDLNLTRTANTYIQRFNEIETIQLYPNPAQDICILDLKNYNENVSNVEVLNLQGQVVYSIQVEQNQKQIHLPIGNISKGIYLVQVHSTAGVITRKLIKN